MLNQNIKDFVLSGLSFELDRYNGMGSIKDYLLESMENLVAELIEEYPEVTQEPTP